MKFFIRIFFVFNIFVNTSVTHAQSELDATASAAVVEEEKILREVNLEEDFAKAKQISDFVIEDRISDFRLNMRCSSKNPKPWNFENLNQDQKHEYIVDAVASVKKYSQEDYQKLFKKSFEEVSKLYQENEVLSAGDYNRELDESFLDPVNGYVDCGLSNLEKYYIKSYTRDGHKEINRYLRSHNKKSQEYYLTLITKYINSGLKKIAPYEKSVFRTTNMNEQLLASHKEGEIVTYDAFTSTTIDNPWDRTHVIILLSKTGRYIAPLSAYEHEFEVLIPSGAIFIITKKELRYGYTAEDKDAKYFFIMKEI